MKRAQELREGAGSASQRMIVMERDKGKAGVAGMERHLLTGLGMPGRQEACSDTGLRK
jgi:hypothetical protein